MRLSKAKAIKKSELLNAELQKLETLIHQDEVEFIRTRFTTENRARCVEEAQKTPSAQDLTLEQKAKSLLVYRVGNSGLLTQLNALFKANSDVPQLSEKASDLAFPPIQADQKKEKVSSYDQNKEKDYFPKQKGNRTSKAVSTVGWDGQEIPNPGRK